MLGHAFQADRTPGSLANGVTPITTRNTGPTSDYIPFRDSAIDWHTDGYYNAPTAQIRSMVLHCARQAASGGENQLLDPEQVYMALRDANPAHIDALMAPDAMTIPPRLDDQGQVLRPEQTGPVFSVTPEGHLHMRYTARTRSIRWREDKALHAARTALTALLARSNPYRFTLTLQPGWGVICNNVLHTRSAFKERDDARLMHRIRCFERLPPPPAV
jgi:hypothetical protein